MRQAGTGRESWSHSLEKLQILVARGWEERVRLHNMREWNRWRDKVLDNIKARIEKHHYLPVISLAAMLGLPRKPPIPPSIQVPTTFDQWVGVTVEHSDPSPAAYPNKGGVHRNGHSCS